MTKKSVTQITLLVGWSKWQYCLCYTHLYELLEGGSNRSIFVNFRMFHRPRDVLKRFLSDLRYASTSGLAEIFQSIV